MVTRTTARTVRFERAFTVPGDEHLYPPGEYVVQTDEEMLEQLSFTAWKRSATTILLQDGGTMRSIAIDPEELERMLCRDAEARGAS